MNLLVNTVKVFSRYLQPVGSLTNTAQQCLVQCSTKTLLQPITPIITPVNGFKMRYAVQRRCRDCFLVVRDGRLYNLCPTHPRHKQMSLKSHEKKLRILTWAGQSKERPW